MNKLIKIVGLMLLITFSVSELNAQGPTVSFENTGLNPGDPVDGLGTVHPYLNIQSLTSSATELIVTDGTIIYGAPFGSSRANNCLEDASGTRVNLNANPTGVAHGFADLDTSVANPQHFELLFPNPVTDAAVRVFDHGDLLPFVGPRIITATALHALGSTVSTRTLNANPGGAGDACSATFGQHGYFEFSFPQDGITEIEIEISASGSGKADFRTGFDSIDFTLQVGLDIKPGSAPNCFNNDGKGTIPFAILGSDTFDVLDIDPSTLDFNGMSVKEKNNGDLLCAIEDTNGDYSVTSEGMPDGRFDLVCKVADVDGVFTEGSGTGTVTGMLWDGTPFESSDSVCVTQ